MLGDLRLVPTPGLDAESMAASRRLMDVAFDDFTDDDWAHALGGWHALITTGGAVVTHAAVVPRTILIGGRGYAAGYVEAVAVRPDLQGRGLGSRVMAAIGDLIRQRFELGVLSTGEWHFYERLGWERWRGPAFVREHSGHLRRAEDEDDAVMALRVGSSATVDLSDRIACDERAGDSW